MSLTIDRNTLDQAKSLYEQNKINEAWQILGNAGDNYAKSAAQITSSDNSVAKTLVKETWENTVGTDVYDQKFDSVATRHLENYLGAIEDINGSIEGNDLFILPNTTQIEASYKDALEHSGVSVKAAIDGIINTAVDNAPIPGWTDWLDLFDILDGKWSNDYDIEPERVSETFLVIRGQYTISANLLLGNLVPKALIHCLENFFFFIFFLINF